MTPAGAKLLRHDPLKPVSAALKGLSSRTARAAKGPGPPPGHGFRPVVVTLSEFFRLSHRMSGFAHLRLAEGNLLHRLSVQYIAGLAHWNMPPARSSDHGGWRWLATWISGVVRL